MRSACCQTCAPGQESSCWPMTWTGPVGKDRSAYVGRVLRRGGGADHCADTSGSADALPYINGSSPSQVGRVCTAMTFSAPRLTGPRRHALPVLIPGLFRHRSSSPRPAQPGSAVSACLRGGTGYYCFRMRVRGPVHGMQGPWERQKLEALPKPRTSLERTYAFLGHPSWPKAASRRAMRMFEADGRVCAIERTWP